MLIVVDRVAVDSFTEFVREAEPRLKVALCVAFGRESGLDATSYAFAYGWEHWDRVAKLKNPAGYLWVVGRNHARRHRRRREVSLSDGRDSTGMPWFEPALPGSLSRLTERQRTSVVLIHGLGWTYAEVAELLGLAIPTVQKHTERGLASLRKQMGVDS